MNKNIYFKVESKEAREWLHGIIKKSLEDAERNYKEYFTHLVEWDKALSNPLSADEIEREKPAEPEPKRKLAKKKPRRVVDEDKNNPLICIDHPTYGGIRMPRTDCTKCWSVYKKLHPLDYERKRREFERAQKKKEIASSN